MTTKDECRCGHHSTEHNYSPSGQGVSFCRWSEGVDKYGHPVGNCGCDEFDPLEWSCDSCNAAPGEACRPYCTAEAAIQNMREDSHE